MDFATEFIDSLLTETSRIEKGKNGKALTQAEIDKVKAAAFLRKIMGIPAEKGGSRD